MKPVKAGDESDATPERSTRTRARITELSSALAFVASFLALSLGVYQARLMNEQTQVMQKQSRASVWPYLSIGYSLRNDGKDAGYTWEIDNDGVGPARIESVTLTLDGKPVRKWSEVFRTLYGDAEVSATYGQTYGKVLPPSTNRETTIDAVRIIDLDQARVFHAAQDRFEMTICYCSVYDECWIARRQQAKVQSVDHCDTTGSVQFEERL